MRKFFLLLLGCGFIGCYTHRNCRLAIYMPSENHLVVRNAVIDISEAGWMNDDKVMQLLQPILRRQIDDGVGHMVSLSVGEDVRYGRLWPVVYALNRMKCDVRVEFGYGDIAVWTHMPIRGQLDDCYFIDIHEIRNMDNVSMPFTYEDGELVDVARKVIAERSNDSTQAMEVRCSPWLSADSFLGFISMAKEKGYEEVYLGFPLGKSVGESVREFLDGVDGL